ncbi:hypothetical protein AQUCO_01300065v1 [Aquilegia coerulea]|uniref:Uncharacterized protein n=1 Tax=Aquilegia coerulea TaxID=218851 RepID=A0A2G5DZI6_AQUCA|nr:hypothetical protein AQUCO_01300065v1 [Aquilegia coerulea]PIA48920.1 hypothetical protein AQUCO_01300065v1 [Aquilegia coerulea]
MASLASTLTSSSFCPNKIFLNSTSSSFSPSTISINRRHNNARAHFKGRFCIKALSLDFSGSFFEGGMGEEDEPSDGSSIGLAEEKEEPQCPPGLRQYETMVVLRPDMSEDERLTLTQKYEEGITLFFSWCVHMACNPLGGLMFIVKRVDYCWGRHVC